MNSLMLISLFSGICSIIVAFIVLKIRNKRAEEAANDMSFVKPFKSSNTSNTFFELIIEDVFHIAGRGVVVTGRVNKGSVRKGDLLYFKNSMGEKREVKVNGIEIFKKILEEAHQGDNVGLLISNITKESIKKGDRLISKS
jgi:translation elongation factor EF-Tu-like GTPase